MIWMKVTLYMNALGIYMNDSQSMLPGRFLHSPLACVAVKGRESLLMDEIRYQERFRVLRKATKDIVYDGL